MHAKLPLANLEILFLVLILLFKVCMIKVDIIKIIKVVNEKMFWIIRNFVYYNIPAMLVIIIKQKLQPAFSKYCNKQSFL